MEKVKENNEKRDFIIIAGAVVIVVCLNHWLTDDEIEALTFDVFFCFRLSHSSVDRLLPQKPSLGDSEIRD